ncbi:MAG TPA: phosphate-starvation-inducible PsiE family protein [Actinomycetota bacterium]|nr:phosphate-starvation-inducible PsiE family protein [Actinomycetota bacterium]
MAEVDADGAVAPAADLIGRDELPRPWEEQGRRALEFFDTAIYLLVAVIFLAGAGGMLGYTVFSFANHFRQGFADSIVTLINDLLLVMIMMEVLKTIVSYLEDHAISLKPFLFIGIISATRRVLTVGAAVAVQENLTHAQLWNHLDDLIVNATVILALAVAIRLVGSGKTEG